MNKISILLVSFFSLLVSCNKDDFNNTADKVGISKVTYFPVLTVTGANLIIVAKGGTFTDPGAVAKAGTATVPVTASGTVNVNQTGVYSITYSAVNTDGFTASATRTVAVYSTAPDAAAHDLSGNYLRAATGVLANWAKLAPGLYLVTNPGGAASGGALTVIAFNATGYDISVPSQRSSDGNISSASGAVYISATSTYSWVFNNPGYGTSTRTFVKQ